MLILYNNSMKLLSFSAYKWILSPAILLLFILPACAPEVITVLPEKSQSGPLNNSTSIQSEESMSPKKPLVIAHRGARSVAPENTIAAARKAVEIGADMWELDVSVSADGELFLMHDDTLNRTCNAEEVFPDRGPWNVKDFTLAEIRRLDCGQWFNIKDPFKQIEAGNVPFADQQAYKGEKAPTLREALEFTKANDWAVNIEIKQQPDDATARLAVEKTVALVAELGMDDGRQVVISSFEHEYLKRVSELNGQIPVQVLTSEIILDPEQYLAGYGTRYINPKSSVWSYQQIKELSAAGIAFNVWTVNDESVMKSLINANVNGIITDFPQLLIPLFEEN